MLAENFKGHEVTATLTNIKVVFYPANSTSVTQPMDQGVSANRTSVLKSILETLNAGIELKIDLKVQ